MTNREIMEYDVVVVGAGPSGLSAAIKLKQLTKEANKDLSVCVIEKGSEVGAHIVSGAVIETKALDELIPDWKSKNSPLNTMGIAAPCSFEVSHKQIPSYKLHVLYYNFPELGKSSSKVTKSVIDRINNLYIDEVFQPDDSLIIIINDHCYYYYYYYY